jgi:tRNA(Ile)-lysidine synthase
LLNHKSRAEPLTHAEFAASLATLASFEASPFLAVAVSGGPDSLALALLADRWARERGGEICAVIVDHGLRPESGDEARRVGAWLGARGIRHEVLAWTEKKPASGIQEAARVARYRLLVDWCRDHHCLHLLTGHHRGDQIETHLIRRRAHSGVDGLAGMSAIRELADCRVLRPLLGVAKDRLSAFLEAAGQPFIADPSNLDPAFERSRYRRRDGANADWIDATALLTEIRKCAAARQVRERAGNAHLARAVRLHPAGFALLDPGALAAASDVEAERLLSALVATIGGALYPARRERISRLHEFLNAAVKRGHTLGGCRFIRWQNHVLVARELASAPSPTRLSPGEAVIWDRRFKVVMPKTESRPLFVGYLGSSGVIELNRLVPQLRRGSVPRLLFPILPAMRDDYGIASVPHLRYRREGVSGAPQIIFRPVNPLTRAEFAVV